MGGSLFSNSFFYLRRKILLKRDMRALWPLVRCIVCGDSYRFNVLTCAKLCMNFSCCSANLSKRQKKLFYKFLIKNVTPCHGFPLVRFKNFPVWDYLACHSISFMTLSCHGLGMACHAMSREVTACHVTSKGKFGVAKSQTQLY